MPEAERVPAPALRVPLADGERVRRRLVEEGLLRQDLKPLKTEGVVLFPLARGLPGFEGGEGDFAAFEPRTGQPPHYSGLVDLPDALKKHLPTSYDLIGDVLVLKLPAELVPHAGPIGEALLASVKRARLVVLDRGVTGTLRVRDLEPVAGEGPTETVHVEHGIRLRVNPAKAYFSPRLATERARVADAVREGERVADLCAGVGPFAILIARRGKAERVDAVDLNPDAVETLRENARLNRVEAVVHAHHADARAFAAERPGLADRVVTNLPHGAHALLEAALAVLKPEGGTWHYHVITSERLLPGHLADLDKDARTLGRLLHVTTTREVRTYSPEERHYAVDLRVRPAA